MIPGHEEDRFALLASIDEVTDGTVLLGETVARLLEYVVPAFADVATLDTISPQGVFRRIGSRVEGPGREELEKGLLRRRPIPEAPVGLPAALASGESQLIERVTEEDLRAIAADEADFELLRGLELRSMLDVPLLARGRIVGALACGVGPSGRDYGPEDLRFAEVLSGRLALALDNAGLSAAVSGLEQRLEATLTNLAEAVIVRDGTAKIVFANPAAARLLAVASADEITDAVPGSLMALYDVFDEQGRRLELSDLPSAIVARGGEAMPLLVRNVIRATGEQRWLLHKATPVLGRDGSLAMVVSVIEDLTEVKRAELAQRLLAEAGHVLSSSLDYHQSLQRVAELTVSGLADRCQVLLRSDDDGLEQVAVAHAEGEVPAGPDDLGVAAEAVESAEARLAGRVIAAPLALAGQPPIGAIFLAMDQSRRTFDESDLVLARELGQRAAIAVENARLYAERSEIAATLQRSLLPPELPAIPGFRLAGFYRAAGEQNEVGGDFYDAFEVRGGWMVVVGDVAGRGAEAAALTSLSRYTLRTAGKLLGDPVATLEQLNAALRQGTGLSLVSVCCALLRDVDDDAKAELVLAGHPPALHLRDGRPEPAGVFAPFLGAYERGEWTPVTVRLEPSDQLVLYTDGVIDTVGEDERFGEDRLIAALRGASSAGDSVARIEAAVRGFARGPQADDIAVIAVERLSGAGRVGQQP
ncbi:MAG TPA: SpoIIE family protein phosphatase [Solirubrobacteraceae bacterium]|nr:SpoIIE family protein phosphatase [Solirubrobacteraceae bacterium]